MSDQPVMTQETPAQAGDVIFVDPCCLGEDLHRGEILEIRTHPSDHYLVRWDDGRESVFFPSRWSHVVHPKRR